MRTGSFVLSAVLATTLIQDQALADGSIAVARSKDDLRFNMGVSYNFSGRADADAYAISQCEAAENEVAAADRGACTVIAS